MPIPKRISPFWRFLPCATLLLTACTLTTPDSSDFTPSPETAQWKQHQTKIESLTQYQARGSFAYFMDEKKIYAHFFWQQYSADHFRLLLTNPFGGTELDLDVKPDDVKILDSKGQRYVSRDIDDAMYQLTGMRIPIESMRLWLLGSPGTSKKFQLTKDDYLQQTILPINDVQWRVVYRSYETTLNPALPNNMEITQDKLRIKLKIERWTL